METWLAPKKAAQYIKEHNPGTMIGERTLRLLIKNGFPCLHIDSRTLINVSTFESDLAEYTKKQPPITHPQTSSKKYRFKSGTIVRRS